MADVQHSGLTDPNLHEPKGVGAAAADKVYVTDGAGSGDFHTTGDITRTGVWNYDDNATSSTPITLTPLNTFVDLTNDGLGANTLEFPMPDVADPWNTSTNRIDFSDLAIGDWVDIRIDVTVTTTAANTVTTLAFELGLGGTPFEISIGANYFKAAGTYNITRYLGLFVGSANTRDNPAKIKMKSDAGTATVEVNGWYMKVGKRGLIT